MARRRKRSSRRKRADACFDRRLIKNSKMRKVCKVMARANCVKADGTSKKGKRCRTQYMQTLRL